MSKTMIIKYSLYQLYDRLLDGVDIDVTISYNLDDIAKNGTNKDNIKAIGVIATGDNLDYLLSHPFDIQEIYKRVKEEFEYSVGTLEEEWGEELTPEEYEQIIHLYEPTN